VGMAGGDISGSLAVDPGVPRNMWQLTGAVGGVLQDFARAGRFLSTGQPGRALESALPVGVGNILKAAREAGGGAVTRRGKRVWDERGRAYMPSPVETGLRVAGFRSSRRATVQARQWEGKKEKFNFSRRRTKIYEAYRAYLTSPTSGRLEKILDDIKEYNDQVIGSGRIATIPLITTQSIRRQMKRMMRPTRREAAAMAQ